MIKKYHFQVKNHQGSFCIPYTKLFEKILAYVWIRLQGNLEQNLRIFRSNSRRIKRILKKYLRGIILRNFSGRQLPGISAEKFFALVSRKYSCFLRKAKFFYRARAFSVPRTRKKNCRDRPDRIANLICRKAGASRRAKCPINFFCNSFDRF